MGKALSSPRSPVGTSTATTGPTSCGAIKGEVEFSTMMLFDSIDNIRAFTGEDYATAHVPAEARAVLSRFDERSPHYEMLLEPHDTTR